MQNQQTIKVYEGFLNLSSYGENDQALLIGDEPLACLIQDDIECYGNYLSVRYFLCKQETSWEQAEENLIKTICGAGDVEYSDLYSEPTGYLWTEESLTVGGHDLLKELTSSLPEYCFLLLQVAYNKYHPEVVFDGDIVCEPSEQGIWNCKTKILDWSRCGSSVYTIQGSGKTSTEAMRNCKENIKSRLEGMERALIDSLETVRKEIEKVKNSIDSP